MGTRPVVKKDEETLRKKERETEARLSVFQAEINSLLDDKKEILKSIDTAKETLLDLGTEKSRLLKRVEKLREEESALVERVSKASKASAQAEEDHESKKTELSHKLTLEFKGEKTAILKQISELNTTKSNLEKELGELNKNITDAISKVSLKTKEFNDIAGKVSTAEKKLSSLQAEDVILTNKVKELGESVSEYKRMITKLPELKKFVALEEENLVSKRKLVSTLESNIVDLQEEVSKVNAYVEKRKAFGSELDGREARLDKIQKELELQAMKLQKYFDAKHIPIKVFPLKHLDGKDSSEIESSNSA